MKRKIITSLLMLSLILVLPQADAQSDLGKVVHKSIKVTIDIQGNVSVIHEIRDSNQMRQLDFVDGTVSNLKIINEIGREEQIDASEDSKSIVIPPDKGDLFVTYDLDDVLMLKDGVWTLNYLYLESTIFALPKQADLVFINGQPVMLDEKKKFNCHGCQLLLEYSINEPKIIEHVNWEDKEFFVEIRTLVEIESFEFNQPFKEISFNVNGDNRFVTAVIPLELLWQPYTVFFNDEKIEKHEYINNGTHVWLSMKPSTSGEISIIGTTVVPEFPIIAPLAIGFLMIIMIPFLRKFNLH